MDVCPLLRQHAPAFFLIEEDNGLTRKALAPGRGGGLGCILFPYSRSVFLIFELRVKPSIEEHQKSKTRRLNRLPFSSPLLMRFTRRSVQPVAHECEGLS